MDAHKLLGTVKTAAVCLPPWSQRHTVSCQSSVTFKEMADSAYLVLATLLIERQNCAMVEVCLIAPAYPYSTTNDDRGHGLSLAFQPCKQSSFGPFSLSDNMDTFLPLLAQLPASCPLKV